MTQTQVPGAADAPVSALIAQELPYLRRHARALSGSQRTGDGWAAATLEAIITGDIAFDRGLDPRVALFRAFHAIRRKGGGAPEGAAPASRIEEMAQRRLAALTPNSREALLLHSIEGFGPEKIAAIMEIGADDARALVSTAFDEMAAEIAGRVMIIEDEVIIAMDLRSIVSGMGHHVTGVARTRDQAVALGKSDPPDLILADIQLADRSSGIDAVKDLFAALGERPAIFITAFPERLLTGERPEPAFLIAKPYTEEQVRSAVSQAMFFAGTETLGV